MNICHLKGLLVITRIENGKSQADGLPESIETHTKVRLNKQKPLFFHIKETVSQTNVEVYIYPSLYLNFLACHRSYVFLHFHQAKLKKELDLPVATAHSPTGHTVEAIVCQETLCNRHRSL